MKIIVGKRWDRSAQYIGRGSPLGNPFRMEHEGQRDQVCDKYESWFNDRIAAGDETILTELRRLYVIAKHGDLVLGCFCAPKRCHGLTIKNYLEKFL